MLAAMDGLEDQTPGAQEGPGYPRPTETAHGSLTKIILFGVAGALLFILMASGVFTLAMTEELVGFALVSFGLVELIIALARSKELKPLVTPLLAIATGVILWIWPDETLRVAGLALGFFIVARGFLDVWAGTRKWHDSGTNAWIVIRGLIGLAFGGLVLLYPHQSVEFVVIVAAFLAIVRAVLTLWFVVAHRNALATISPEDTSGIVTFWLTRHELDSREVEHLEDTVFLFRGDRRGRLWRYAVFMSLSTAIATFGIATDSTAVVIGAMLIAPLMPPILGLSASLLNGRLRSAGLSGLIVVGGVFGSVVLSWLLAGLIPNIQAVVTNAQVMSRTAPSLLDLAIAIAAGAAGAYGVARTEVSDTLPGVAVAIALVPPLSVMGITLHAGDLAQAGGAALLFLTNLFSIVLVAGLVFLVIGYGDWSRLYYRKDRIRISFALIALGGILIAIPLTITGQNIVADAADLRNASEAVSVWLGEDSFMRINEISVAGDTVHVQLIGPGRPPPSALLAGIVLDEVGRPMTTRIAWIEEHVELTRSG